MTRAFILANLVVFVLLVVVDSEALMGNFGSRQSLYYDLGLGRQEIADGELWRMLTTGFIHFGIIHLAFNSLALWNIGQMLEPLVGMRKFALMYVASLLAGSAGALILDKGGLTGGASGAVFGLFGAAAVALRQHGVNPFQTSIGSMLLINLVLTFSIPNISIGGHLGGLAGGAICGTVLATPRWKKVPSIAQWGVPILVMVVSVIVGIAVSG